VVIKFRKAEDCIFTINNSLNEYSRSYYIGQNPTGLIKKLNLALEMISLQDKKTPKRVDYVITQTQMNTFELKSGDGKYDALQQSNVHAVQLGFTNSVKELFFVVQDKLDKNPNVENDFVTPYQYSSVTNIDNHTFFTNSEQVKYIDLDLDGDTVIDEVTGNVVHIRAIQPSKHHSRTPLLRRFYMYSFALEPERWYPTGQLNFSAIKNQTLKIGLFDYPNIVDKQLRVYAQSYNILRVENGTANLLFNT
jgi:hypothetical protein